MEKQAWKEGARASALPADPGGHPAQHSRYEADVSSLDVTLEDPWVSHSRPNLGLAWVEGGGSFPRKL